jgi:hypothetical protein
MCTALYNRLADEVAEDGVRVAISVLREHFTKTEKQLLSEFVNWGRRVNAHGEPTNPVLLFTAHELTMDCLLSAAWKQIGGTHARFAEYDHTRDLLALADATQQIYLDLPPFSQARREYWDNRRARQKAARRGAK